MPIEPPRPLHEKPTEKAYLRIEQVPVTAPAILPRRVLRFFTRFTHRVFGRSI